MAGRLKSVVIAGVFVLFLFAGNLQTAFAQVSTGTLLGIVKDTSGAVVAGATITARNTDTNLSRTVTTGEDGAYRIPALPTGSYELRVEHEGFQTQIQTGLTLTVSQEETVNVTLQIGATQQAVSVTGEATLVDTTSSAVGGTVNQTTLVDLPLNGRSYEDLTMLQPGVSDNKNQNNTNRGSSGHYFSSNGATVRSNNYYLDGTSLVNPYGASAASIAQTTLGVDGIQEYRVVTSGIPAELGMVMGSQMLIVSRGGTNTLHGSAYEFLRNSVFDARNTFDVCPTTTGCRRLPEFQRNDFGGAFGGPIQKDKTFFYATYEALRESKGITTITQDLPATIDANGNAIPGGACRGAAGAILTPGNSIGQCSLLPAGPNVTVAAVMAPFLSAPLFPLPNLPGNKLTFPYQQPTTENYGQMRVDHTFSGSDTAFARVTMDFGHQEQVQPYPQFAAGLETIGEFVTLGENHIFSPALLNTVRVSFSRSDILGTSDISPGFNPSDFIDHGSSLVAGWATGGASVTGNPFTAPTAASGPLVRNQNIHAYQDDLNYTRGKHSLKFGLLVNHYAQYLTADAGYKGSATFSTFPLYVQGLYQRISAISPTGVEQRTIHYTTIGAYAQDDWRATSRLTLNLGLRYEISTMPFDVFGNWAAFINPATDPGPNSVPSVANQTLTPHGRLFASNPTLRNFGPRIGFAWDVFGNGKTSVRGAYDLLYDIGDIAADIVQASLGQPPLTTQSTVIQANQNVVLAIPFNFANFSTAAAAPRILDYYFKQPYLHLYNLTIDRQLPWSSVLTVSYVGSRGIHLTDDAEGNPAIPEGVPGAGGACVARPAGSPVNFTSMIDGTATACWLGASATGAFNQCPNPVPATITNCSPRVNNAWPSFSDDYTTRGDSWYNALQVGFTKRLTDGLQMQASYTYSKSLDTNPGQLNPDQNGTNSLQTVDPINVRTDRGRSATDIPNNFKFNVVYYIPRVKSENVFAKAVFNGWWVSGIWTNLSGFGFSPVLGQNRSRSGTSNAPAGLDRPSWAPGYADKNITSGTSAGCGIPGSVQNVAPGTPLGTTTHWYDPCAFVLQPNGFLGNVGRDSVRGPSFRNLDFSVVKDTGIKPLGENGKLEFRAEIFNILNRANYALPNRTVFNGPTSNAVPGNTSENPPATAGQILSTVGSSRQIQLALKLSFLVSD